MTKITVIDGRYLKNHPTLGQQLKETIARFGCRMAGGSILDGTMFVSIDTNNATLGALPDKLKEIFAVNTIVVNGCRC